MRKFQSGLLLLFFVSSSLFAQTEETAPDRKPIIPNAGTILGEKQSLDFSVGANVNYEDQFWMGLTGRIDYTGGPFSLSWDIEFKNDQKYAPAAVLLPSGNLGGFYFMLNEGGISYNKDSLHFKAGRYKNYDEIDSPYTLFLNSEGIAANTLMLRWETSHFIYQSQWIELNRSNAVSSPAWNEYQRRKKEGDFTKPSGIDPANTEGIDYGFPDRGANIKIMGIKVKDWRFGFMDAVVYSNRYFDAEYFLSPMPMYFTQYFKATEGRPWASQANDNSMLGLFWDLKKDVWDAYFQLLVDDFALGFLRFLYDGFSRNPWKTAWALGGRYQTSVGRFGFHHGGALKYTFEPIGVVTDEGSRYRNDSAAVAYGYTYYPETRYFNGGETVNLLIKDSMIGYKYGQNNLAFQADYQNTFNHFLVTAELELVLAGNNSPANPWHDYDSRDQMYKDGKYDSQLFNDGQIEKNLEFRVNVSRKFGSFLTYAALAVGGRFNKLVLTKPDENPSSNNRTVDDEIWIWKASNSHEPIFRVSLGFIYLVPIL